MHIFSNQAPATFQPIKRSLNLYSLGWTWKARIGKSAEASLCTQIYAPVSESCISATFSGWSRETRACTPEHKGVRITRVPHAQKERTTLFFNCEPWQEETNFSGRPPLKRQMKQGRVKCECVGWVAPPRIDIVTLEWSQVKQMGKVTNNKCSKDLANERESDRPVNSTHSHAPRMICGFSCRL